MKHLLSLIFVFGLISNAYAQMDCESIPSCAELGYTQASCPEGSSGVKCPFDETKFYCSGGKKLADASDPVVTPEDWTGNCADTIANCTALNSNCQCTACASGYVVSNGNCVVECSKSAAVCAKESKIFNAAACTCDACPTNYLFVDGACKKICTKVDNCTTYDSEYDPCNCTACKDGYMLENGVCVVDSCFEKCKATYPLFAGQENTEAVISQIKTKALAAYAASQFYVGDKNGDFGQGKWYLPSIGEWMYAYGTDVNKMTSDSGASGATGDNVTLINGALSTLAGKGVEAASLRSGYYLSSSEGSSGYAWRLNGGSGYRFDYLKIDNSLSLRCSMLVNLSSGSALPKIGDVMYSDKTYGAAADYNGSKTPVGVISAVAPNGQDVTIINLKDLTFSSIGTAGNFNPDNPYGGSSAYTQWCTSDKRENITGIQDIYTQLLELAKASDNCPCQFYKTSCSLSADTCAAESKVFNSDTCACEDCPTGQKFNATTKTCEEAACDEEPNCIEYDDYCSCVTCEDGYINVGYRNSFCTYQSQWEPSCVESDCWGLKLHKVATSKYNDYEVSDYDDFTEIYDEYSDCHAAEEEYAWAYGRIYYGANAQGSAVASCVSVPCGDSCYRCTGNNDVWKTGTGCEDNIIHVSDGWGNNRDMTEFEYVTEQCTEAGGELKETNNCLDW